MIYIKHIRIHPTRSPHGLRYWYASYMINREGSWSTKKTLNHHNIRNLYSSMQMMLDRKDVRFIIEEKK